MLKVELLNSHHERESFDCGIEALNSYLKNVAKQHIDKGISKTFVLIDDIQPKCILGYMTLLLCEIKANQLPLRYAKKYPSIAPAAKLGRLAISQNKQRQGLGSLLMLNAMERIIIISKNIGIIGFFVDAKNEAAKVFYQSYGFIALETNPLCLFLPFSVLVESFAEEIVCETA